MQGVQGKCKVMTSSSADQMKCKAPKTSYRTDEVEGVRGKSKVLTASSTDQMTTGAPKVKISY